MVYVNENNLELLLKQAQRALSEHEKSTGSSVGDWSSWYARFVVGRLREHDEKE